jgi:hypothetical protein
MIGVRVKSKYKIIERNCRVERAERSMFYSVNDGRTKTP